MRDIRYLTSLHQGQSAVVRELTASGSMRRRLQDIGLIEGTKVECIQKSPLGDPTAFLIRGAVIALRSEDASGIILYPNDSVVWEDEIK
ncbi:FeoA family protein [Anaerolentibacter hominis]|uniref:FeoA family protein n=1 Tax=Anaerolentibacter hominis TaxID=3079009 RepID=UPI0031B873E6